jgi:hypothetical protein
VNARTEQAVHQVLAMAARDEWDELAAGGHLGHGVTVPEIRSAAHGFMRTFQVPPTTWASEADQFDTDDPTTVMLDVPMWTVEDAGPSDIFLFITATDGEPPSVRVDDLRRR